mgnify:CR=1 FL=1
MRCSFDVLDHETFALKKPGSNGRFIEHTNRVIFLEDDDVAHLHNGGYGIYRMERILTSGVESPVSYEPTVQSAEVERTVEEARC